jgi:transposase InsO family protein
MSRKRHKPEEIVAKLRQVEVFMAQGRPVADAIRSIGVTEVTLGSSPRAELRDELLNGEVFSTLQEAKVVIEGWRRHYNTLRPHSSLGYVPPAPEVVLWPAALPRPAAPATPAVAPRPTMH